MGFAPRHYFSSLVFARLLLYFSHFYYFFVAITPGLQTTVSSVVWSACFYCCLLYRLQADFQPVRIPQLTKKKFENTLRVSEFFGGKSGIRSATLFFFTCYRSAPLILLSFLLFLCRYHAGVANNRFIGCLVGLLLLLFIVSFASRLPTRSNPTIDEKKFGNTLRVSEFFGGKSGIRTHDALPHT